MKKSTLLLLLVLIIITIGQEVYSQAKTKHFVFFSRDRELIYDSSFYSNPGISGAQIESLIHIVGQLAKDYNAVHIKTQEVFDAAAKAVSPEQWIWDGVHPLPQGHELIARNWLQEVSARW